jgi:hypothetical protein
LFCQEKPGREVKEQHSLSLRQIERITGINRGVILKA